MEFPHVCAQITAARMYKVCKRNLETKLAQTSDRNESFDDFEKDDQEKTKEGMNKQSIAKKLDLQHNKKVEIACGSQINEDISFESIEEERAFYECPFYEARLSDQQYGPIRIPLEVNPRSGMLKSDFLLFTNGRKTMVFDPICRRYFSGSQSYIHKKEPDQSKPFNDEHDGPGIDPNMPIMKNAEVFSSQSGIVYLIGGEDLYKVSKVAGQAKSC